MAEDTPRDPASTPPQSHVRAGANSQEVVAPRVGPPPIPASAAAGARPRPVKPIPVIPVAEPGVVTPPPFAEIYSPQGPQADATGPGADGYYPPSYRPRTPAWPAPVAAQPSRPGILSFLAISSIVVAGLSIFASLFSGCSAVAINFTAERARTIAKMNATFIAQQQASLNSTTPAASALSDGEIRLVKIALQRKSSRPISPQRMQHVEAILKQHGNEIFQNLSTTSATSLSREIADAGREFAAPGKDGADFFVFKDTPHVATPGRLRLHDATAIFTPVDLSLSQELRASYSPAATVPTVTATNGGARLNPTGISSSATSSDDDDDGLADDDAAAIVERIRTLSNKRLTAAQANALKARLTTPDYLNWIQPSPNSVGLVSQVKSAVLFSPDGTLAITFAKGTMMLDKAGNPVAGTPAPKFKPGSTRATRNILGGDRASVQYISIEAIVSLLLAGWLLTAGIMALRQKAASRWMYLVFVGVKILCSAGGLLAMVWLLNGLETADRSLAAGSNPYAFRMSRFSGSVTMMIGLTAAGLLYALLVLGVLLGSREVKEYYRSAQ